MMGERMGCKTACSTSFGSKITFRPTICCVRSTGSSISPISRLPLAVLQLHRAALDRSRADDPDADRRLLLRYPLGTAAVRRGSSEPGLSLVLPFGSGRPVPDHSTFSKNRHGRFAESDLFRRLFEEVVGRCIAEGLVGGEGFAVDASLIEADANRQRSIPGTEWNKAAGPETASRSVREYLAGAGGEHMGCRD